MGHEKKERRDNRPIKRQINGEFLSSAKLIIENEREKINCLAEEKESERKILLAVNGDYGADK